MSIRRPNFSIRILRNKVPSQDNTVTIWYLSENSFSITFRDPDVSMSHDMTYTADGVRTYIRSLTVLLRNDSDPFHSIQFLFPGFPTFLYSMDQFYMTRTLSGILDLLDLTMASWPVYQEAAENDKECECDEEEEECDCEDDEGDDNGCICGDDDCNGKKLGCEHGNCDCEDDEDQAEQNEEQNGCDGCDCHKEGGEAANEDQDEESYDDMPPLIRVEQPLPRQLPPPPVQQEQNAQQCWAGQQSAAPQQKQETAFPPHTLFSPFQHQSIWNSISPLWRNQPYYSSAAVSQLYSPPAPTATCSPPTATCNPTEGYFTNPHYPL